MKRNKTLLHLIPKWKHVHCSKHPGTGNLVVACVKESQLASFLTTSWRQTDGEGMG